MQRVSVTSAGAKASGSITRHRGRAGDVQERGGRPRPSRTSSKHQLFGSTSTSIAIRKFASAGVAASHCPNHPPQSLQYTQKMTRQPSYGTHPSVLAPHHHLRANSSTISNLLQYQQSFENFRRQGLLPVSSTATSQTHQTHKGEGRSTFISLSFMKPHYFPPNVGLSVAAGSAETDGTATVLGPKAASGI